LGFINGYKNEKKTSTKISGFVITIAFGA
jgi:hypothetical protein